MGWFFLLELLYFFLPAGIANMAPVLVRKVGFLNKPVWDLRLGKNKTWRGVVFGVIFGLLVVSIQRLISWDLSFFSYSEYNFLLVGFLMGLGAISGDIVESFFKRRKGIKSGEMLFPFDQVDFILGGLVFLSFYFWIGWLGCLIILIEYFILHVFINFIGYLLRIRSKII